MVKYIFLLFVACTICENTFASEELTAPLETSTPQSEALTKVQSYMWYWTPDYRRKGSWFTWPECLDCGTYTVVVCKPFVHYTDLGKTDTQTKFRPDSKNGIEPGAHPNNLSKECPVKEPSSLPQPLTPEQPWYQVVSPNTIRLRKS